MTEFYEDYIDAYGGEDTAPLAPANQGGGADRVGAWARTNANPNYVPNSQSLNAPLGRTGSRSAPGSQYAPSSYGGTGSIRRKNTRRTTRTPSRIQSTYEEEEEGYVSGEYEDGPFELTLIRVKVRLFYFQVQLYLTVSCLNSCITKMTFEA